jgi:RecA/RadA recombinase
LIRAMTVDLLAVDSVAALVVAVLLAAAVAVGLQHEH